MDDNLQNQVISESWLVEVLRVSAFSADTSGVDTALWEKLMQEQPEASSSRPKEQSYQYEGLFEKGKLILSINPIRTDLIYTPPDIYGDEGLPIIGQFFEVRDSFYQLAKKCLNICNSINRMALGVVLFQPVENKTEGYNRISKYLPCIKLDPINSSDFLYQINRPRESGSVDQLSINRLSKWSVMKFGRLHLQLNSADKTIQPIIPYGLSSACRVELDINTSQEFSDNLPKDRLSELFDELVNMADEISLKGDI